MAADEGNHNPNNNQESNVSKCRCESCNRNFETPEALEMHNSSKHYVAEEPTKVNYKKWGSVLGIVAVVMLVGFLIYSNNNPITGATVLSENLGWGDSGSGNLENEVQKVTLSFKDFNYYPNSITVKAGIPVEITLEKSIGGCFRSFNIKELGVKAYSGSPSETIKFTPTKKGTFEFACGMRMGVGKINVV